MSKLVTVVLVMAAFAAVGCDDKKGDAKPATTAAATATGAAHTAAPAKSAAPGGGW
jgi:hypothetical protein